MELFVLGKLYSMSTDMREPDSDESGAIALAVLAQVVLWPLSLFFYLYRGRGWKIGHAGIVSGLLLYPAVFLDWGWFFVFGFFAIIITGVVIAIKMYWE
jgi:hypothetical protein